MIKSVKLFFLVLIAFGPNILFASDLLSNITYQNSGSSTLRTIGKGKAPKSVTNDKQAFVLARRAAELDGLRQLVALLNDTKIIRDNRGQTTQKTSGIIRGSQVVQTRQLENGFVEIVMELPIKTLPDKELEVSKIKENLAFSDLKVIQSSFQVYEVDESQWQELIQDADEQSHHSGNREVIHETI